MTNSVSVDSIAAVEGDETQDGKSCAPRKPRTRAPKPPGEKVPKSKDKLLTKVGYFLPKELAAKINVAAVIHGQDPSDLVAKALWGVFSPITFHGEMKLASPQKVSAA